MISSINTNIECAKEAATLWGSIQKDAQDYELEHEEEEKSNNNIIANDPIINIAYMKY